MREQVSGTKTPPPGFWAATSRNDSAAQFKGGVGDDERL